VAAVRLPVPAAVACAAVLGAGCGGGGDDDAGPDAVREAAGATRAAQTAKVGWRVTTKGFGLPAGVTVKGTGTTALDGAEMDLRFDLAPVLKLAGAPGGADAGAGADADVVVRGKDVYVKPPRVRGFALPGGADWVALDLARALDATGEDAAGLADVLTLHPGAQLDVLTAAEDVEEVGRERVAGTDTTRYRGSLDLTEYADGLPEQRRERARKAIEAFGAGGKAEQAQPFEVWIDADDKIRRMTQTSRVPGQPGVPRGEVGITMELREFGAALDADRPAKADTFDATGAVSRALAASQ
jgi:hypothetical protein